MVTTSNREELRHPIPEQHTPSRQSLDAEFDRPELVLALVGAVGTELCGVRKFLEEALQRLGYDFLQISVSADIMPLVVPELPEKYADEETRLRTLMDAGDRAREMTRDASVFALGVANFINAYREAEPETGDATHRRYMPGRAYIISSLKRPEEVEQLRLIYGPGFFLFGVHAELRKRRERLTKRLRVQPASADHLISRDDHDGGDFGQRVTDTFHLADFFVHWDGVDDHLRHSIDRSLEIIFGHPFKTPTFDEFAMFSAFTASLRSADLSRQVGAVVARGRQIIATGANDCPAAGGGSYWPQEVCSGEILDHDKGRDFTRGEDSNRVEQERIIADILSRATPEKGFNEKSREALKELLSKSRIQDLTEFGRVVHAEMDALLSCARIGVSTTGGVVYSTTFPCHNCAKHIISAGISRVVFIEPYRKSKAPEFHDDAVTIGLSPQAADDARVVFEPFVGVGPRRFLDLFSVKLGSGSTMKRKNSDGKAVEVEALDRRPRLRMLPVSYLGLEKLAINRFNRYLEIELRGCGEQTSREDAKPGTVA